VTDPEAEGVVTEAPTPAPRPRFSILVTVLGAIMAVIYIGLPLSPLIIGSGSPLDQLEQPEESLDRLVTRELDLREGMRQGQSWEWRLYRVLSGAEDPIRQAGAWYDELVDAVDSPSAELHRTILLAESGDMGRAREAITRWKSGDESDERMGTWLSAAYLEPVPAANEGRAMIAEIHDRIDPDWFTDTLRARIASRIGDAATRAQAEAAIVARGRALQTRLRALIALVTALLVAGILACVGLARRGPARLADAPLPPIWSPGEGFALFVRGLGAPQAIILLTFVLIPRQAPYATVLAMAADLSIFWWVARYLRARESSARVTFGLRPRPGAWARLAGVTLALIGLALVGDAVIDAITTLVGLPSHWADGFAEDILWDSRGAFVVDTLNVTVWAPIVEELVFRGLLFGTLRTRLPVWPAAVLSAALFALPHGYELAGSLSVLMSGVLWALAYERTRSLLPGLLAHSANNLMSTLWAVALLR
jgi:membrane protease YdiL (CAAX protease family)